MSVINSFASHSGQLVASVTGLNGTGLPSDVSFITPHPIFHASWPYPTQFSETSASGPIPIISRNWKKDARETIILDEPSEAIRDFDKNLLPFLCYKDEHNLLTLADQPATAPLSLKNLKRKKVKIDDDLLPLRKRISIDFDLPSDIIMLENGPMTPSSQGCP